jgi:hypothetical protein
MLEFNELQNWRVFYGFGASDGGVGVLGGVGEGAVWLTSVTGQG